MGFSLNPFIIIFLATLTFFTNFIIDNARIIIFRRGIFNFTLNSLEIFILLSFCFLIFNENLFGHLH